MADNLFTAYMDYLKFMDSYNRPTDAQRAKLGAAIEAACMEYFEAEKGEK